jgi:hypothetical protein
MRPLEGFNAGKKYADQIKPFNFLLTCHIKQFGHPTGAEPERFHLIAPYWPDSRHWLKMPYVLTAAASRLKRGPYRAGLGAHGDALEGRRACRSPSPPG